MIMVGAKKIISSIFFKKKFPLTTFQLALALPVIATTNGSSSIELALFIAGELDGLPEVRLEKH